MRNNEPMWTDAAETPAAAVPMTNLETRALVKGDTVRVVDPTGRSAQGVITRTNGVAHRGSTIFQVGGKSWPSYNCTFYRLEPGAEEITAPVVVLGAEELRDLMVDLAGDSLHTNGRAVLVTMEMLVTRVLGWNPTTGQSTAEYGGKSKAGWINQHFGHAKALKALAQLVDDGVLRAVRRSQRAKPSEDDKYVMFRGERLGWVLTTHYDDAVIAYQGRASDARRAELLAAARETIADRHAAEVETELARLLTEGPTA